MTLRPRASAIGWGSALVLVVVAALLVACQKASDGAASSGAMQRTHVESMTVECNQVTDGQRSWLELSIGVDGERPLRMPLFFKQGGRPVDVPDTKARELLGEWLKVRAQEIAIFGTIGLSFGQTSPAVTIDVDQRPAFE
jgi:hypothetical protein